MDGDASPYAGPGDMGPNVSVNHCGEPGVDRGSPGLASRGTRCVHMDCASPGSPVRGGGNRRAETGTVNTFGDDGTDAAGADGAPPVG